jgi:aminopeptidase
LTFFHVLFDENVSSHMALGNGLTEPGSEGMTADERLAAGLSTSIVHHDFTIGGPEIEVSGVTKGGREEPLLVGGNWCAPL